MGQYCPDAEIQHLDIWECIVEFFWSQMLSDSQVEAKATLLQKCESTNTE